MKFQAYQPNWSWNNHTEKWLRSMCIGRTLNFPCGMSNVGDVRADMEPKVRPDVIADLLDSKSWEWEQNSFDTVICDPPFEYYNKFAWVYKLFRLSRQRVILSTLPMAIRYRESLWKRDFYLTLECGSNFIRHWQIFTKQNKNL